MSLRTAKRWLAHARERLWRAVHHLRNLRERFPGDRKKAKKEDVKREVERREKAKEKLQKRVERKRERAHDPDRPPDVDTGAYGGSQAVGETVVVNASGAYGAPISSRKRAANHPLSLSNPSSDHNEANTTAYAWDLATFSGANLAYAIARALGISGYSTGNYNSYYIVRNGVRYRVQILWAVSGHFNHVHVGIRRA